MRKERADEYKEGIYKLFQAVAESEKIHAQRHLRYLYGATDTKKNLEEAAQGESREFETMYPEMLKDAEEENEKGPAITFRHVGEVEKGHHKLFREAIYDLDNFPVRDYFICNACGYVAVERAPEKCPVCGAVKKAFYQVPKVKER
jgi:rubrerythrin